MFFGDAIDGVAGTAWAVVAGVVGTTFFAAFRELAGKSAIRAWSVSSIVWMESVWRR